MQRCHSQVGTVLWFVIGRSFHGTDPDEDDISPVVLFAGLQFKHDLSGEIAGQQSIAAGAYVVSVFGSQSIGFVQCFLTRFQKCRER